MSNTKNKLLRISLASQVLSYLSVFFSIFVLALTIITIINISLALIFALVLCVITGTTVMLMVITTIILGCIEISLAKRLKKSFGGISSTVLTIVFAITDVLALGGIILVIVFQILGTNQDELFVSSLSSGAFKDLQNKIVSISICISLAACLTQGIFNSIYFIKIRKEK